MLRPDNRCLRKSKGNILSEIEQNLEFHIKQTDILRPNYKKKESREISMTRYSRPEVPKTTI